MNGLRKDVIFFRNRELQMFLQVQYLFFYVPGTDNGVRPDFDSVSSENESAFDTWLFVSYYGSKIRLRRPRPNCRAETWRHRKDVLAPMLGTRVTVIVLPARSLASVYLCCSRRLTERGYGSF